MRKVMKTGTRVLSVVLVILVSLQVIPMNAFAADVSRRITGKGEETKQLSEPTTESVDADITMELVSKRTKNQKVFLRTDGSETALIASSPIHYFEDEHWVNIDNSLEEKQVKGKNVFQNRTNAFKVSLPCDLSSDDVIEIENAGYSISFNLELPGLKDSGKIISAKMDSKNLLQSPKDKNSAFDAVDFDKLSSEIIYNSVDKNTNLEYIVTADGLKENIVLTKKPEKSISYTYTKRRGTICTSK